MPLSPERHASRLQPAAEVKTWQPAELASGPFVDWTQLGDLVETSPAGDDCLLGLPAEGAHGAEFEPLSVSPLPAPPPAAGEAEAAPETGGGSRIESWLPADLDLPLDEPGSGQGAAHVTVSSGRVGDRQTLKHTGEQAAQILARAQQEAHTLLAQVQADAERIQREASLAAEEVRRQAHAEGIAAAHADTSQLLQAASAIVSEVEAWRDDLFSQGEMMMLRLVIEIAQTIFGDGLPLDPEVLGQAFERALAEAKTLGNLRIYVHPEDAAVLDAHWVKQKSALSGQRIELVPSDIIKRGGCFVEGEFGSVDARVETQFTLARDALLADFTLGELETK